MIRNKLLITSFGLIGLAVAGQAGAACMVGAPRPSAPLKPPVDMHFISAVYRPDQLSAGSLLMVSDTERSEQTSIVGLWQFKFEGFSVDYGTQAWHSDGTETMFSGAQNPETGDFCQGVWRQTGPNTYSLNHIAMGWTAPGAGFGTRVHFHVEVKLDAFGNAFAGQYTAGVYAVTPANPFDESNEVASGTGTVSAVRVVAD